MKYVILRPVAGGVDFPVFCVNPLTHEKLAAAFAPACVPISAGFCEVYATTPRAKWRTFGFSNSLGLEPGKLDAAIIEGLSNATDFLALRDSAVPARVSA
jgi:hypothetical protein